MTMLRCNTRCVDRGWILLLLICLIRQATSNQAPNFVNFNSVSSPLWVEEDTPIGTVIGLLVAEDVDTEMLYFNVVGDVAQNIVGLVRVNDTAMNITLLSQLDREVIPDYTVVYEVRDGDNKVTKTGFVYVIDVNDNPPHFLNLPYRAEIPENSPVGAFIYKVFATDPDLSHSGLVNYNITTPQGMFAINQADGTVTLVGQMDYETEKFYQLELMAMDRGDPVRLNSTTDLIINVQDIQDTAPYFNNLPYVAEVYENAIVGTPIIEISALDGDRGIPNDVNYSFVPGDEDKTSYFNIDAVTGVISLALPLDREQQDILDNSGVLEFSVLTQEMTDTPQGVTMATTPVTIRILDVNDETPTFNQIQYVGTVLENTQDRIPVNLEPEGTQLNVKDYDEGDNGRFELYLEMNGQPFHVFEPYPTSVFHEANILLRVKNSSALDYEKRTSFTFMIIAKETSTPEQRHNSSHVTIYIEDMNDNWPEFTESSYTASIQENPLNRTMVIQVTATDADSGQWGQITYSLRGASAHLFWMDPSQGIVYVNVDAESDHSLLDREKQAVLFLTVEAEDGGGLRSSSQLEIILLDVNDNAPMIDRDQYEGYVNENSMTLERPLVVEAVDDDQGPINNDIMYSIVGGNPYNNFTINQFNGSVTLNRFPLNYENMPPGADGRFVLTVMARDNGQNFLSSTCTVIIYVQDENDEVPFFLYPGYFASMPENSTSGMNVTEVEAYDNDGTSPNNDIIYRIESGAKDNFKIDANTGLIKVESGANLDLNDNGQFYGLKVIAIDRGTPSLTGTVDVNITITDVNNKPPMFLVNPLSVTSSEDKNVDQVVVTYTAFDPDETALLKYYLLDDVRGTDENGENVEDVEYLRRLFRVNSDSGDIIVNSTLDRETVERVVLKVFVEDIKAEMPDPIQTATGTVSILLSDVNDNAPMFTPSDVYYTKVSEASQPGVEVTRVTAVDMDKNSENVRYDIMYDTLDTRSFVITPYNTHTGVITLNTTVDHEVTQFINITVRASDNGSPPLDSLAVVHIEIEDINDNSPQWQVFDDTVYVWENATVGTVFTFVNATDMDSAEYGRVMYFIVSGAHGKFAVDNQTGVVSVKTALDREQMDVYTLTFEARDNNNAPPAQQRKVPGIMQIILVDVNDNVPQFSVSNYSGIVQENVKINTPVTTIHALDADIGDNGYVDFYRDNSAGNVSGFFNVNPSDGQVYVSGSLQGRHGNYMMVVIARDRGVVALYNTTQVYIAIEDVNDHTPEIYDPVVNQTIIINENLAVHSFVYQVRARDLDIGDNGIVHFRFTQSGVNEDWKKFNIDKISGNITNTVILDRELQEVYTLEVVALDQGTPQFEDRRTVSITLRDENDNPPRFDRTVVPVPYLVSALEETEDILIAHLNLAHDPDSEDNAVICYFLVGGDEKYREQFFMNKTSGDLFLGPKLDREEVTMVSLIVKATHVCQINPGLGMSWNESDWSLLLVNVDLLDINDNAPRFSKTWFTAGVTKDTQHGSEVIDISDYSHDVDVGPNAVMTYSIKPPFRFSPELQNKFDAPPFIIGPQDGIIYTDVYFQQDMQGYIEFEVHVQDSLAAHIAKANISIYLLHQEQRVKVIILGTPDEVDGFKDIFASFLSNITGAIINVDMIQTHQDSRGKPDPTKTDMFIHGIIPETGEVMDADELIELIDNNYASLVDLFKQYNVIEIQPAVVHNVSTTEDKLQLALILVAVLLGLLLIIIILVACVCRRKDKRKLKAATAVSFGANETGLNKLEMPGTNVHSYEGSNPIWLEQYEQGYPKEDEDTESKNSLDENTLEPPPHNPPRTFDDQEMSMDMYNDEYDNYNKIPNSQVRDSNAYLKAALREHQRGNVNDLNSPNHHHPAQRNGSANGVVVRNVGYDNVGYRSDVPPHQVDDLEATEI